MKIHLPELVTQLISINEALRTSNRLQTEELSQVRQSSERYWSSLQGIQGEIQYQNKNLREVIRNTRCNHVPEGREASIPIQTSTEPSPSQMEAPAQELRQQYAEAGQQQEVPLQWQHVMEHGRRPTRLVRLDELRGKRYRGS